MSWQFEREFHSKSGNIYTIINRSILGYYPHYVEVRNDRIGIEEFGEGNSRHEAFNDLRKKIGIRIKKHG